jgi:hypothetical protein
MDDTPTTLAPNAGRPARLRLAGLFLTLLAALAIMVGACSSSGSSSDSSSAPPAGSPSGSSQSGAVAFAQCVRSHGVPDFPDPQNGHFLISGADQSNPNFNSAVQSCQQLLGPGGASNGGGSNNAALLNFAHCMQTHGVPHFPDPTAGGAIGLPQGVDPNSASFQKAWQDCQSDLPGNLQGQQP